MVFVRVGMVCGVLACAVAQAQTLETVMHNFPAVQAPDGAAPGGLIADAGGNLYGTAAGGGASSAGVVFKLDPNGIETVIYSFKGGADGKSPNPGIVLDAAGNIYGTAVAGGVTTGVCSGVTGCGVVFKVDPAGNQTVLHSFTGTDGISPNGGVVMDAGGNLYGTTWSGGGQAYAGEVFKVDPAGNETVLHSFTNGADGGGPLAGLSIDAAGNLYGTTRDGGIENGGVVFKMDPSGNETVLYTFQSGADGNQPYASPVMDGAGNLYGSASGGAVNDGVIYKISAAGTFSVLYTFAGGTDGSDPGPVTVDAVGNVYGTAYFGGAANVGLVYKLDTSGHRTTLFNLPGGAGGANPGSNLLLDAAGNLYGTTLYGGIGNIGLVYKLDTGGHETVEYSFPFSGDGANIYGGLAIDADGNLYGTANTGGEANQGIVYKIDPAGNETVLWAFRGTPDGGAPYSGVTFDSAGNLYGTTQRGGTANAGTVYKLDPAGNETVLYSFQNGDDGGFPQTGVALDAMGNVYGATQGGSGLVYKLDPAGHESVLPTPTVYQANSVLTVDPAGNLYGTAANGVYEISAAGQQTMLGNFSGVGGTQYGVTLDAEGNLYGAAWGSQVLGTVFKLDPAGNVTPLYAESDGIPSGGVIMDSAGNLYGTIGGNARTGSGGAVFKLDPAGNWTELVNFPFWSGPSYGVVRDTSGNLYGTSSTGGPSFSGMVYKLGFATYAICGQVTLLGGGLGGVTVTLSGSASGSVTTDASGNYWLSGAAGGTYTVAPTNAGYAFSPASVSFTNLGINHTAAFAAECKLSVSSTSVYLDATSQSAPPLSVTGSTGCPWDALASAPFLNITSGASGSGNGTVAFSVTANSTGAPRTGTLSVGNQVVSVTQRETSDVFADVPPAAYYFDFTDLMFADGITSGCSTIPLDYCPNATTDRAEMAVLLIAAIEGGSSFTYTTTPYFTDVPATSPYFKFIQKLKDLGITSGCSATAFCPNNPVTRAEMAVFIIVSRFGAIPFTYPAKPYFTDVLPSNPFFPFVQEMAQSGITAGCAPGLFCPNEALNRGQMAVFVVTGLLNELLPAGTPVIGSATPNSAAAGQTLTVSVAGVNTHFTQGTSQVAIPAGVTASNIAVLSETSLSVDLSVSASAALNPISIVVRTGSEEAVLPNGFRIQAAQP